MVIQPKSEFTFGQSVKLTMQLSWPAIMAQLSSILMQYIDAAMVGRLGADDSASVGLVSTTLWLFWGVCSTATSGYSVQVAHRIGAQDLNGAKKVMTEGVVISFLFGLLMALIGISISGSLPKWLGGSETVCGKASVYFLVFAAALPFLSLNYLFSGVLRAVGKMKLAGGLNILMCILDVIFNFFFIFPTRTLPICGTDITLPGLGLGVLGAALGTVAAELSVGALLIWEVGWRDSLLAIFGRKAVTKARRQDFKSTRDIARNALKISTPMTIEHIVICGAQIMVTIIVAPLGIMAIAANSFAVTAEALCYMPGYGIGDAASTLTGQSYGAGRKDLAKRFAYITVGIGMAIMSVMGLVMWLCAYDVMSFLTPVEEIRQMGTSALRIEAWAEPMFAASIVAYGAMVGVGDATRPAIMNFSSIWLVRIPLAAVLAPRLGLDGVWIAMCIELCFRGGIFLWRLFSKSWLRHGLNPIKNINETDMAPFS
ncbi:MAG: MATE family efflux transporter [Muribaculaceae bacterium]|nr:MATE family efflux transporter [Muribaculaceae bacterium]